MSLFRIAESDYTRAMSRRIPRGVLLILCVLACGTILCADANTPGGAGERTPHELYDALNALRVDPATVYRVEVENRISLRRGDATLSFDEGKLGFFRALDGRITGAVFSGRGHALAAPRDPVEKQQMARFLNASVLDEDFSSAYMRFTDGTAEELLKELHDHKLTPENDDGFAARWESPVAQYNNSQSLRIMDGLITQNPKPYFYAGLDGAVTGPFDVFYDLERREPFLLGQFRQSSGPATSAPLYDVWVSYVLPGDVGAAASWDALNYAIDTTIEPDNALEGTATVEVQATAGGERLLGFELARALNVDHVNELSATSSVSTSSSANSEQGAPVAFFQNEGLPAHDVGERGTDTVFVVLPQVASAGQHVRLYFHYRGNVIEDAGNGVLIVGARDSWYPHLGDESDFARYDLTMRWPRKMQLVATGTKIDERVDGEYRVGRWRTENPVPVAGFNLGDYASASVAGPNFSVNMFANRQLEESLRRNLSLAPEPLNGMRLGKLATWNAAEGRPTISAKPQRRPVPRPHCGNLAKRSKLVFSFMKSSAGHFRFAR